MCVCMYVWERERLQVNESLTVALVRLNVQNNPKEALQSAFQILQKTQQIIFAPSKHLSFSWPSIIYQSKHHQIE